MGECSSGRRLHLPRPEDQERLQGNAAVWVGQTVTGPQGLQPRGPKRPIQSPYLSRLPLEPCSQQADRGVGMKNLVPPESQSSGTALLDTQHPGQKREPTRARGASTMRPLVRQFVSTPPPTPSRPRVFVGRVTSPTQMWPSCCSRYAPESYACVAAGA